MKTKHFTSENNPIDIQINEYLKKNNIDSCDIDEIHYSSATNSIGDIIYSALLVIDEDDDDDTY